MPALSRRHEIEWLLRKRRRERAAVVEGEQTLVRDGSFERWIDLGREIDIPAEWTVTRAGTSILRQERHVAHVFKGFSACRAEIDGSGNAVDVAVTVPLTGATTYAYGIAHKEDTGAALEIVVREAFGAERYLQDDGSWAAGAASRALTNRAAYTTDSVEFTPAASGNFTITVRAATASKTFWWDFHTLAEVAAPGGTAAVITPQATAGDAPLPIFVHARNSTLLHQTIYTAYYSWNFGDPGSAHNVKEGAGLFNCAHPYETPGQYTVTLTLRERDSEGNVYQSVDTQTITVNAFDGPTRYVKNGGSDAADGLSDETAWETIEHAVAQIAVLGKDLRVLCKRGSTFTTADGLAIPSSVDATYEQPIILAAYGTGDPPLIQCSGTGSVVALSIDANGVRAVDLEIEGTNPTPTQCGLDSLNVDNALALRCEVHGFTCNVSYGAWNTLLNEGAFLFDCNFHDGEEYCLFAGGTYLAIVGCTLERSVTSHVLRVHNARSFYLADNACRYPSNEASTGRHALKLHNAASSPEGGSQVGQETEYGVIVDNEFRGGGYVVSIAPQSNAPEENPEYIRKIVFERNRIFASAPGALSLTNTLLWLVARDVYVRNNLFHGPRAAAGPGWLYGVNIDDYSDVGTPVPQNIFFQGNSVYDEGWADNWDGKYIVRLKTTAISNVVVEDNAVHVINSGTSWSCLIWCVAGAMRDNITERNNDLYMLPAANNCWVREVNDEISLATWQAAGKGAGSHDDRDPKFAAPVTYDLSLQSDSPCIDDGEAVDGLWTDQAGVARALVGAIDMGALEYVAP